MIKIFEKVIKDNLSDRLNPDDLPLSYLKFSTVTSGAGLSDKVIFMVFKNRADLPFLCLKTVRNYEAKHSILRNFHNLQKINKLVAGSSYEHMFSHAVCLHDDGENIFSIETACVGSRVGKNKNKLMVAVGNYIAFQEHLASRDSGSLRNSNELFEEAVKKSEISEVDKEKLFRHFSSLPFEISLPRIIQHGDLTPDNILLSGGGLCIVDYDDVGITDIPGFDLFCLFRRLGLPDFSVVCKKYFLEHFEKIGGKFDPENYRGLLFLYHFIEHTKKKGHNFEGISVDKIISDFERLYPATI